jgi:DNA-directed RNA polymerase subunit RPC12/RpoP
MAETKAEPRKGDPCPACGGELRDVRAATDEERRRALDKENPINLGPGVDVAPKEQIETLGPLARCADCGYKTRYKPEAGDERRDRDDHTGGNEPAGAGSAPAPRRNANR